MNEEENQTVSNIAEGFKEMKTLSNPARNLIMLENLRSSNTINSKTACRNLQLMFFQTQLLFLFMWF